MVICYLQESSFVILSWKGNDVLHRGLVMLGNKLHIFISFPYCVVLSTHTYAQKTLNLQHSKHTYGGGGVCNIQRSFTFPPLSHGNSSETNIWFLKKITLISSLFSYIHSCIHSQQIHTIFKCHTYTNTSGCSLSDVSSLPYLL